MAPWVPGPAAKTSMPRDNEGDRRLCSLLMSTQSLWFCIWNRDVKLCSLLDCQKKAALNHSSLDLFCASFPFVPSAAAHYCHYQGHKWVRDGADSGYRSVFSGSLTTRLLSVIKMMFEIICLYRDAGNMRETRWHAGKDWVRFKLTALTSWASHTQTILFLLFNSCCLADAVHFFPSHFRASNMCVALPYVQWHVTKCGDCFSVYWRYHFSIPTVHIITPVSTH